MFSREVVNLYLTKKVMRESSRRMYERPLKDFCAVLGDVEAADLSERMVEDWMDGRTSWGSGTRWIAITGLKSAFNWAVKQGRLAVNPIAGLTKPESRSRGAECVLTEEQHRALMDAATPQVRDLLSALWESGARPGAVASITARELQGNAWIMQPREGRKRKKKFRVLLTPRLGAICRRLAEAHPTGPLFRNRLGLRWTKRSIANTFRRLRRKRGIEAPITAYWYRHTFASNALARGASTWEVAKLLNTSIKMIEYHYGHEDEDALRATLAEVR